MSLRRFAGLVAHLPADSALRSAFDEHPDWDRSTEIQAKTLELLADIEAETRAAYLKRGSMRPEVLTVHRPWESKPEPRRADRHAYRRALLGG